MIDTLRINVLPLSSSSFCLEDDLYFADSLRQEGRPRQKTLPQGIRAGGMSSLLSKSYSVLSSVYTLSSQRMDNFRQLYSATRDLLLSEKDKTIQNNILQGFAYITLGILDG